MYFIYKIENLVNHKHYIGSSRQDRGFETRWYEHQQNARLEKRIGYNYPLSKAIRKYGIKNFEYTILVKDITTPEMRWKLEHDFIKEYHSMCNDNGYNQTENTEYAFDDENIRDKHATPCCAISVITGEKQYFNTVSECAIALGTDRSSIHACIAGKSRHSVVKNHVIRKYNKKTMEIIENNIPIEKAGRYKLIEINGEYKTFSDWCKFYNITRQSVYKRMKKQGMDIKTALSKPKVK